MTTANEAAYFDRLQNNLYSAVISDMLDEIGLRNQTMAPRIRPLTPDMVVVGRARTVLVANSFQEPEVPYQKLIEVLDSTKPGDVFIGALSGSTRSGFFGELTSATMKHAGGRGAIIDGTIRDQRQIIELGYPVFSIGSRPSDSYGRNEVIAYDVTVQCGGVTVNPGDLVFGDMDGVVVVPRKVEEEVIEKAFKKVEGENVVLQQLKEGAKISDMFAKYKIL